MKYYKIHRISNPDYWAIYVIHEEINEAHLQASSNKLVECSWEVLCASHHITNPHSMYDSIELTEDEAFVEMI